jgi:hypothetical protein
MTDTLSLDRAVAAAQAGSGTVAAMLSALLDATLAVPSGGAVEADGSGFRPVLFDRAGVPMVACFTARERIGPLAQTAPYALEMPARAFLSRVPAGHGVVVDPGHATGFEIDPAGLARLLRDAG